MSGGSSVPLGPEADPHFVLYKVTSILSNTLNKYTFKKLHFNN